MASKSLNFDIFGRDRTASKAIHGVGGAAAGLTRTFAAVGAAIAAAFAVTRIVNFAKVTVTEFAAAQDAQNRLSFAFQQFPSLVGANIEALRELNEEMARKTKYDDDAFAAGQATLAQFGLTEQQLKDITPLLADYASRTGKDLPTAASDLGKAILGQGRALKDVGIDFDDAGSAAANFEQIMEGLRTQVGGFAESEGATFVGQLEILKNGFGEVKERIGGLFAPALGLISTVLYESVLPALDDLVTRIGPDLQEFFEKVAAVAGDFFEALAMSSQSGSLDPLAEFFGGLSSMAPAFAILETVSRVLGPIAPVLAEGFETLGQALQEEGVLDALSTLVVDLLPPLVELLVAVAPLIPPIASLLSTVLVPAIQWAADLVNALTTSVEFLMGGLSSAEFFTALESLPLLGDGFKSLADSVFDTMRGVAGVFNGFIGAIEGAINGMRTLTGMAGTVRLPRFEIVDPRVSSGGGGMSGRPALAMAQGGVIRATPGGTFAQIGEAGTDEAVIPLTDEVLSKIGRGIGGGGGVTFNVNGTDPNVVTQMIMQRLRGRLVTVG